MPRSTDYCAADRRGAENVTGEAGGQPPPAPDEAAVGAGATRQALNARPVSLSIPVTGEPLGSRSAVMALGRGRPPAGYGSSCRSANRTFAGRSASRRMYQRYHAGPYAMSVCTL